METREHNGHIGYTIFGYSSWEEMDKNVLDEHTLKAFYVVSDATYFAIDFSGKDNISEGRYAELKLNTEKLVTEYNTEFCSMPVYPDIKDFIKTGGGNHRAYNHQGFHHQYENAEMNQRWALGRDKILIPAVKVAFDTNDNFVYTFISLTLYYTHLFGDLLKGNAQQLNALSQPSEMLKSYIIDCESLNNENLSKLLENLKCILTHVETSEISSYQCALPVIVLDYLGHEVPGIIKSSIMSNHTLELRISPKKEHIKLIY